MPTPSTTERASENIASASENHRQPSFLILALGSIGVVYGDIGTSPLYALREAVLAAMRKDGTISEHMVLGVLSLILWSLILVVTIKYVIILLTAERTEMAGVMMASP